MERKLRKKVEANWKKVLAVGILAAGMIGLTVACASQVNSVTDIKIPTPIVWQSETPLPPLPPPTVTNLPSPPQMPSPTPSPKSFPTPRPTDKPTFTPTPVGHNCEIGGGTSSMTIFAKEVWSRTPKEKKVKQEDTKIGDETFLLTVIKENDLGDKMIFITKDGSTIETTLKSLTNDDFLNQLQCGQFSKLFILTGGNNGETFDKMIEQYRNLLKSLDLKYPGISKGVFMPYITKSNGIGTTAAERKNNIDKAVYDEFNGKNKTTVILLTPYFLTADGKLNESLFPSDDYHGDPSFLYSIMGAYIFSKN